MFYPINKVHKCIFVFVEINELIDSTCPGLSIDELSRKKLDLTAQELSEEKALAYSCLS